MKIEIHITGPVERVTAQCYVDKDDGTREYRGDLTGSLTTLLAELPGVYPEVQPDQQPMQAGSHDESAAS